MTHEDDAICCNCDGNHSSNHQGCKGSRSTHVFHMLIDRSDEEFLYSYDDK